MFFVFREVLRDRLVAQDAVVGSQSDRYSGQGVLTVVELSEVTVHNPRAFDNPFLDDGTCGVKHLEFDVTLVADSIAHTASDAFRAQADPFHDCLGGRGADGVTEGKVDLLPHISAGDPSGSVQERDFDGVDLYVRSVSALNGPLLYTQV